MAWKEKVGWPVVSAVSVALALGLTWWAWDAAEVWAEQKVRSIYKTESEVWYNGVDTKVRSIQKKLDEQDLQTSGQRAQIFELQRDADALKEDNAELKQDVKTVIRLLLEDRKN